MCISLSSFVGVMGVDARRDLAVAALVNVRKSSVCLSVSLVLLVFDVGVRCVLMLGFAALKIRNCNRQRSGSS
jgi:hypothetical protein